ncbi:hypothetical protein [Caloranaerobacter sp. DY30410]|uniref:hypothetical protein n=1 Tax=Caloranaerobacter sp. DY30410 TaxID=3238305 RepID=UPI003D08215D
MILNYVYLIISCIYGLLSIVAGILQLKNRDLNMKLNCILGVIPGGLLVIMSNLNMFIVTRYLFYILIIGLVILHISAIINGLLMYGKLNLKHHFIRLIVSILILLFFILSNNFI